MRSQCRGSNAFTLVELLVVIGIIAVLIGILLPSLGKAREASKSIKCMSNLHQLALATTMYVSEQRGCLPSYNYVDTTTGATVWWPEQLTPYINIKGVRGNRLFVWECPSYPSELPVNISAAATHYGINYDHAVNYVTGGKVLRVASRFKQPSTLMLLADTEDSPALRAKYGTAAGFSSFTMAFPRTYCVVHQKAASPTIASAYFAKTGGLDFRHRKAACIAYLDGHAGQITQPEVELNQDDLFGHLRQLP